MALYLWLAAITGARPGEICALQARDIDLERGNLHIAFNYLVKNGQRVRKETKTHQDRYLAIDPVTSAMLREHLDVIRAGLADFGLERPQEAYVSQTTLKGVSPWNPDWATHKAGEPGLTFAILPLALATAVAGPPPSGTTPTLYRRLTARALTGARHFRAIRSYLSTASTARQPRSRLLRCLVLFTESRAWIPSAA
jgi:integrase